MDRPLSLRRITLSLAGFVLLWAVVTDAWGYSDCWFQFEHGKYVYAYLSRLIWAFPAVCLMIRHRKSLQPGKMFMQPRLDKSLVIVLAVSLVYAVGLMLFEHKGFWFNRRVSLPFEVVKYMIVGLVEETVFRGWGVQALSKVTTNRKAVILSAAFFVLVHWPAYLIKFYRFGTFDLLGMLAQSFSAAVCGVVFCWLLKKGRNLWNPIIAHSFYDLALVMLVG